MTNFPRTRNILERVEDIARRLYALERRLAAPAPAIALSWDSAFNIPVNTWTQQPLAVVSSRLDDPPTVQGSSSGVLINVSGWYSVDGYVAWNPTAGGRRIARITFVPSPATPAAGSPVVSRDERGPNASGYADHTLAGTGYFVAGTQLRIEVYQTSGTLATSNARLAVRRV